MKQRHHRKAKQRGMASNRPRARSIRWIPKGRSPSLVWHRRIGKTFASMSARNAARGMQIKGNGFDLIWFDDCPGPDDRIDAMKYAFQALQAQQQGPA